MRIKQCVLAFSFLVAACLHNPTAAFPKEMTAREFFTQYEPAVKQLEDFYRNIQISAKVRRSEYAAYEDTKGIQNDELTYLSGGLNRRIDVTPAPEDNGEPHRKSTGLVVTSDRSFRVSKGAKASDFILNDIGSSDQAWHERIHLSSPLVNAPFGFLELHILDFLRQKDVKVSNVEGLDEQLVKVSFIFDLSYYDKQGKWKKIYKHGWFVFEPNQSWALQKSWYGSKPWSKKGENPGLFRVIEYSGMEGGGPLLKKIENWSESQRSNGERQTIEVIEITDIQPGPVSEEKFTLAAYGIQVGEKRGSGKFLFLAIAGVVILIGAAILAWRKQGAT